MSAGLSRRDMARAASASVFTTSGTRAAAGRWLLTEGPNNPKLCLLSSATPNERSMRPMKQIGGDHPILGEPRIPWEEGQLRAIIDGHKAGVLTVLNMMISGFSNAINGRPRRDQDLKTYRNGCVATLGEPVAFRRVMWRSSWKSAACEPTTPPCGAVCRGMPRSWRHRCGASSSRPTRAGASTKPTFDLFRTVDSTGATTDFLLSALRDADAAERLFRKALADESHSQPRVINTDQARLYGSAIPGVQEEGTLRNRSRHRPVQYLHNILEQDHRAIKQRVKAKQKFREFQTARRTIQGYEAMYMIRKGQARWVSGKGVCTQNQLIDRLYDLAA